MLGDDNLQPPLLTDTVEGEGEVQIPLLFDMVGGKPAAPAPVVAEPAPAAEKPRTRCCCTWTTNCAPLLVIMQDVIDDFAPHIEAEIKRRMDARMERLLSQYQN